MKEINIYVIDNNIKQCNKNIIEDLVNKYDRRVIFLPFEKICDKLKTDNTFSVSSFARIFLSKIEEIEKIIYLDCDSIVNDSFEELLKIDIESYYVAGVLDNVNPFYKITIGIEVNSDYINAGFLYINLKKWREDKVEEKCLEFIEKYKGSVPHHDQGVINAICNKKIKILHPKYNVQSPMFDMDVKRMKKYEKSMVNYYTQKEIDEAKEKPVFIHYTAGFYNRPWNKNCTHPYKNKYIYFMNQTMWKGKLENEKLNKNVRIMKTLHNIWPFKVYWYVSKITSNRKEKRIRKKYEDVK